MIEVPEIPWMQPDQIELMERLLTSFGKKKINVVEWGAGGSTVYFPKFLESKGIDYFWMSIEHQEEWANEVKKKVAKNEKIKVHLLQPKADNPAWINLDHYVTFPRMCCDMAKQKFDFVLVDGRARARCLVEAKFCINPDGIIALHDAERTKYHYVLPIYEKGRMIASETQPHKMWLSGDLERLFKQKILIK